MIIFLAIAASQSSVGFEWFKSQAEAQTQFAQDQLTYPECLLLRYRAQATSDSAITTEIDEQIDELLAQPASADRLAYYRSPDQSGRDARVDASEQFQPIAAQPNAWGNDHLQFARLLSELNAAGGISYQAITDVTTSMDFEVADFFEILDRASEAYDDYVARNIPA
jgi:hypothetical protein